MDKLMPDEDTRISVLENESDHHNIKITEMADTLTSLDEKVSKILIQMANNKGFLHGIVFTLSVIGGLIGAFASEIIHKLLGN